MQEDLLVDQFGNPQPVYGDFFEAIKNVVDQGCCLQHQLAKPGTSARQQAAQLQGTFKRATLGLQSKAADILESSSYGCPEQAPDAAVVYVSAACGAGVFSLERSRSKDAFVQVCSKQLFCCNTIKVTEVLHVRERLPFRGCRMYTSYVGSYVTILPQGVMTMF